MKCYRNLIYSLHIACPVKRGYINFYGIFYYKIFSYIFKQIKIYAKLKLYGCTYRIHVNNFNFTPMDIFYVCLAYGLFVFSIFVTIFTKTSLSAPGEYDFVMKHKLLTVLLVILGLFILLCLYAVFSYFNIPIIS